MQWLCCHFCFSFCLPRPSALFLCCILYKLLSHLILSPPLPFGETGARRTDCHLTYKFSADYCQMVCRPQLKDCSYFISYSPSYFRAYWFELTVFLQSFNLPPDKYTCFVNLQHLCWKFVELCWLHTLIHEQLWRQRAHASVQQEISDQRRIKLLMCCGFLLLCCPLILIVVLNWSY